MLFFRAYAPGGHYAYVIKPDKIYSHEDPKLYAFEAVESDFNPTIINYLGYGGILQEGQEMITEANIICQKLDIPYHFVLKDRLNIKKAELIFYAVQYFYNPHYDLERACKIWNPEADERYYQRIYKNYLKFKKSL